MKKILISLVVLAVLAVLVFPAYSLAGAKLVEKEITEIPNNWKLVAVIEEDPGMRLMKYYRLWFQDIIGGTVHVVTMEKNGKTVLTWILEGGAAK